MLRIWLVFLTSLVIASHSFASGPITCARSAGTPQTFTCSITADATNAVGTIPTMNGFIVGGRAVPGAGAEAPTAVWSCTLTDYSGADVLGGAITDYSTSVPAAFYPLAPNGSNIWPYVAGNLTMTCTGIGDANTAKVTFYVVE